ncbi:MAG: hypothetical protein IJZ95_08895 [Oscillospiraceae bacterium]|nr:hypothetical protein [Oscillospiraceae bacterium]
MEKAIEINHSDTNANILKNADSAFSLKNYKETFELYSEALKAEPHNAHAILYRSFSSAMQSTAEEFRTEETNAAVIAALELQHNKYGDSQPYYDFCYDMITYMTLLSDHIAALCIPVTQAEVKAPPRFGANRNNGKKNPAPEQGSASRSGITGCCELCRNAVITALKQVTDFSGFSDDFWERTHTLIDKCCTYRERSKMQPDPELLNLLATVDGIKANH